MSSTQVMLLSVIFPSFAAAIVVFFVFLPYQKLRRLFVGGAVQTGFVCLFIFYALPLNLAESTAQINAAYLPFMLIVSIT